MPRCQSIPLLKSIGVPAPWHRGQKLRPLKDEEQALRDQGLFQQAISWKPGHIYLTTRRLIFAQGEQVIFQRYLEELKDINIVKRRCILSKQVKQLQIVSRDHVNYIAVRKIENWLEEIQKMFMERANEILGDPDSDIFDEGNEIVVIAEIPDVKKEEIDIIANGNVVRISAREHHKKIKLPSEVMGNPAIKFNNGILELRFAKKPEGCNDA